MEKYEIIFRIFNILVIEDRERMLVEDVMKCSFPSWYKQFEKEINEAY